MAEDKDVKPHESGLPGVLGTVDCLISRVESFAQVPQAMLGAVGITEMGPIGVLVVISIAFFVGCMFVDPIVVILVLVPIFVPVVDAAGRDRLGDATLRLRHLHGDRDIQTALSRSRQRDATLRVHVAGVRRLVDLFPADRPVPARPRVQIGVGVR
jgi:hypothetical protein